MSAPVREPAVRAPAVSEKVSTSAPVRAAAAVEPTLKEEASFSVTVDSEPQGAEVFLDGKLVGRTPMTQTLVTRSYQLRVVSSDGMTERRIDVQAHAPTRFIWLGGDNWVSGY